MSQKPQASKKLGYTPFPDFMATRMVLEELSTAVKERGILVAGRAFPRIVSFSHRAAPIVRLLSYGSFREASVVRIDLRPGSCAGAAFGSSLRRGSGMGRLCGAPLRIVPFPSRGVLPAAAPLPRLRPDGSVASKERAMRHRARLFGDKPRRRTRTSRSRGPNSRALSGSFASGSTPLFGWMCARRDVCSIATGAVGRS